MEHEAKGAGRGAAEDMRSRAYYDDFSIGYERERGRGYHALIDALEIDVVRPFAQGRDVLEAGCGTGLILQRLAGVARSAYGFDLSAGMVAKARARGLNVVLGSVTQVPFADDRFDLVCSFKVLAHVPDIAGAVAELSRVTRPGGHLALEFYNPWSLRYLAKRLAGPRPISEGRLESDVYTRWDSPKTIRGYLPADVELVDFYGVRVLTPFAQVHRVPVARDVLATAERLSSHSPLRHFGGFLVALLRKRAA